MSDLFSYDGESSFDGSQTDPGEELEATDSDPLEEIVGSRTVTSSSHIPSGQPTQSCTGASTTNPFALTIPPQVAAKMATGLYTLILEPFASTNPSEPLCFVYKAVPIQSSTPQTPLDQTDDRKEQNVGSESDFQQDAADTDTETDDEIPQNTPANSTPSEGGLGQFTQVRNSYKLQSLDENGDNKGPKSGGNEHESSLTEVGCPSAKSNALALRVRHWCLR